MKIVFIIKLRRYFDPSVLMLKMYVRLNTYVRAKRAITTVYAKTLRIVKVNVLCTNARIKRPRSGPVAVCVLT